MIQKVKPTNVGFGCSAFKFAVYIANKPALSEYDNLQSMQTLAAQEIAHIGQCCGNGWRKVFNVYSKLLYALDPQCFSFMQRASTWQKYRDQYLLQQGSATALLFSAPKITDLRTGEHNCIHIISGKTYAKTLIESGQLQTSLTWLDEHFAIDVSKRLIVCPYFDYRQLSNAKIEFLANLIKELVNDKLC
ncbi:hypothetical protein CW745_00135 [Psychromonas sp. psych-6C06]|uniref:DUF6942 family protein n=1 Tax=Psychromonas sp. psych-6C06 TaxID=2058089 RepID=UPI000C344AEE|nr:hypothetical protein [Psychromonas sp. psych-6C06]PKF63300.1 hypothetical protein CW745_00135 [Psychromonas sp. psych-6C06]